MWPLKASWQLLFTEIVKKYNENCRSKIALYTSAGHAAAPAIRYMHKKRGKWQDPEKERMLYLYWCVLGMIWLISGAICWIPLRGECGNIAPNAMYTFYCTFWTDNLPQHRHQLSHFSNGLTVERKIWKMPFLPCLPNCKVSGCSCNRQTGICWRNCFNKADRQQTLYQPSP